jgi:hypothetical protein
MDEDRSSIVTRPFFPFLSNLREQAKYKIGKYIDEKLPHEYEKCLIVLNLIQREAWNTAQSTCYPIEKIQALSLVKEWYAMKMELFTNATVVDDAIRFVTSNINNKQGIIETPDTDNIHNHGF